MRYPLMVMIGVLVVATLFDAGRVVGQETSSGRDNSIAPVPFGIPSDAVMEDVFDSPCRWSGGHVTVKEFVGKLASLSPVPVVLREDILMDVSIPTDTEMHLPHGRMSLYDGTSALLDPLELALGHFPGGIAVTTKKHAEQLLFNRVYVVRSEVFGPDREGYFSIQQMAGMTSGQWEEVDGEGGTVTWMPSSHLLVVRQNWKTHREIRDLLNTVHRAAGFPSVTWYGTDGPAAIDERIPMTTPLEFTVPGDDEEPYLGGTLFKFNMPKVYEVGR